MIMKFFKMMLPFVVVIGDYFTKTGRIGYDVNTNTIKYKTPDGVKEIATTDELGGGGFVSQYFVGQVVQSLGTVVSNGFKRLDGQQLLKTQYSALYSVIGDTHDNGSVYEGYFRLPDLTKRVLLGAIDSDATLPFGVGSLGGNETITLQNLPKIEFTVNYGNTAVNPNITGAFIGSGSDIFSETKAGEADNWINSVGYENPEPFKQPFIGVNMLVFTGVYS
jgi:microcystin-dependent protein